MKIEISADNLLTMLAYGNTFKETEVHLVINYCNESELLRLLAVLQHANLAPSIISLKFNHSNIRRISSSIEFLVNLAELNLIGNSIDELPEEFGNLTNLVRLDLTLNPLTTLPSSMTRMKKLEELNLAANSFQHLPVAVGQLYNLKRLDILMNENILISPESLVGLSNLVVLDVRQNDIVSLPNTISNLQKLAKLDCSQNPLNRLPDEIGCLSNLQTLLLYDSALTELPDTVGGLINLNKLALNMTPLRVLPNGLSNLQNLTELNLSNTPFELNRSAANVIASICSLVELDLMYKNLETLIDEFERLTNLRKIDLTRNNVQKFPTVLLKLTGLQHISFCNNRLQTIPKEIALLSNLTYLNLQDNYLRFLPITITRLSNVAVLDVHSTPLKAKTLLQFVLPNLKQTELDVNKPHLLKRIKIFEEIACLYKVIINIGSVILKAYGENDLYQIFFKGHGLVMKMVICMAVLEKINDFNLELLDKFERHFIKTGFVSEYSKTRYRQHDNCTWGRFVAHSIWRKAELKADEKEFLETTNVATNSSKLN